MLKNKSKRGALIVIAILAILLIMQVKTKAAESDVKIKKITSQDGTLEFVISEANFQTEKEYSWGIATSKSKDAVANWYGLGKNETGSTANFILSPTSSNIKDILKNTNTAYLYVKENASEVLVIDGLQLDLTLEANELVKYDIMGWGDCRISNIYGIKPTTYQFVEIEKGNNIPESGWKVFDSQLFGAEISKDNWIKEDGTYYLWVKYMESGSKVIYGNVKVTVDDNGPIVESISVVSPESGTYKTSQTVKMRVRFNEKITGTAIPTLTIRFGESDQRKLTNGTIKDNYIEYSYNIQEGDNGQLVTVNLEGGTIKDEKGNDAKLSCPIISGNTIKANTEGNITNNTENQDKEDDKTNTENENNQTNTENKDNANNQQNTNNPNKENNNGANDDTVAKNKIPQTGENIVIISACILIIGIGAFAYIRYNKYRDIN